MSLDIGPPVLRLQCPLHGPPPDADFVTRLRSNSGSSARIPLPLPPSPIRRTGEIGFALASGPINLAELGFAGRGTLHDAPRPAVDLLDHQSRRSHVLERLAGQVVGLQTQEERFD